MEIRNNENEHPFINPEIAVELKALGVPQVARYWYIKWSNTHAFILNRSYHKASKYYSKIANKPGNEDLAMDIYAAFNLMELREMLMTVWKDFPFPLPKMNDNGWYWEQPALDIVRENETDGIGQVIVELIKTNKLSVKDLYFESKGESE